MVRIATVQDFRLHASLIFRRLSRGDRIVVTRRGRPIGVLDGVAGEDIEDFVLAHHPAYRRLHDAARREHRQGRTRTLAEVLGL